MKKKKKKYCRHVYRPYPDLPCVIREYYKCVKCDKVKPYN